ncbi:hypothetical protein [Aequorivita echinoideorum]|uniref:Uncharacterized protein n=1 Tax=Aequorivita echinoideorum TaxID=1549647 RepID=A0ABS5SAL1_9FLAO|nr:hypothetical protein [Aequorivita echinoideorum]MBT0608905.1 hypothetical protein [Aequorivita echinoideorum]
MKAASVKEIKTELNHRSTQELLELCLRLSKFKKENKELLTYLLFEVENEEGYVLSIKKLMDEQFSAINSKSFFYVKKSVRKILREVKKYIRYSTKKETEIELLLYFCEKLEAFRPSIKRNQLLKNLYNRQLDFIKKKIPTVHEDLQYDFNKELELLPYL